MANESWIFVGLRRNVFITFRVLLILGFSLTSGASRTVEDSSQVLLARGLAERNTRERTIQQVISSGSSLVPVLLEWTEVVPDGIDRRELYIGIAECFGRLRTVQAIPFLIRHIELYSVDFGNTWMKTPEVIESRMVAVHALVLIGQPAENQLISAYWGPSTFAERYAILFTVARIGGPEAKAFLSRAKGAAEIEKEGAVRWVPLLESGRGKK